MNEKQELLNEDLKRFRLLMEYDFYIGEEDEVEPEGDILLEEPPEGEAPEEGGEDPFAGEGDAPEGEEADLPPSDEEPIEDEFPEPEGEEELVPEPMADDMPPMDEPMEDEVELDVTELVQGTDEAKMAADQANQSVLSLMDKFDSLTQSLDKMDSITAKIDNLENEMEKRNPTDEEQLELRSLDSAPYNLKLTDYWSEKEGRYDAMNTNKQNSTDEYVLTQDEVNKDYNSIQVRDSFSGKDKVSKMR